MYTISEQQIEFIISDIRRNGIEMEDLQINLLDHICCIIEQELEASGDFEKFYFATVKKFYKKELREIEEETNSLLTYKNYYAMKKIMIGSGIISSSLLTMGIILKFLHQPGASFGIVIGIVLMSFVFLPLLFTLRIREKKEIKDKVLIGFGTLAAISLSLGVLFKIMHWPWANALAIVSLGILLLLFLPVYFYTGIRNPETKINTIISSLLIIAGCGLFLTLARSPQGSKILYIQQTKNYLRNEQLLDNEQEITKFTLQRDSLPSSILLMSKKIDVLCEELKSFIIETETGQKSIGEDFESRQLWLGDTYIFDFIEADPDAIQSLEDLKKTVAEYNKAYTQQDLLPISSEILDSKGLKSEVALNSLIQIQMYLLQNKQTLITHR